MSDRLIHLIGEFGDSPAELAPELRLFQKSNPDAFVDQAVAAFPQIKATPALPLVLELIATRLRIVERLANPEILAAPDAADLARRLRPMNPSLDQQLLRHAQSVGGAGDCSPALALRVLEIVSEASDGPRLHPLLTQLLRHHDPRVRSKCTLIAGRLLRRLDWLEQRLADPDPRIRANAVESFWGDDSPDVQELFLAATEDRHHRVAANGIVGLYRAGSLAAVRIAVQMSANADPMFRAAAAYAMGQSQDPRFVRTLERMVTGDPGAPRQNALRALVRIRRRISELRKSSNLTVILAGEPLEGFRASVLAAAGEPQPNLKPTAFILTNAGEPFNIEEARYTPTSADYAISLANPPAPVTALTVIAPNGIGDWPAALAA